VYDKERDDALFIPEDDAPRVNESDGFDMDHQPLHIHKSVNSKNQKTNPVSSWKISNHQINDFAFSPDSRHLAVVSEDGSLRIINYLKEQSVEQPRRLITSQLLKLRYQTYGPLFELLRRFHVRVLVTGWQIRLDRGPRRSCVNMVAS